MSGVDFAHHYFEEHRQEILDDWFALLRLPTIGTDPRRLGACAEAAARLKGFLKPLGFETEIMTPGSGIPVPILLAERPGSSATTALFYGHYDVQPEDPLEEWRTPPFEPTLIDERVYCRGAQDNKGQLYAFLQGIKALIDAQRPLPTIKLLLEGQEESGSSGLSELAPILRQRLKADLLLVCDTSCAADGRPAIIAGLRGVQHLSLRLQGADYDLHSGVHGGIAPNPAQGMAALLASLHHADGSIAVPGFLDGINAPADDELELALAGALTAAQYEQQVGCPPLGGARQLAFARRSSFEPTIEVNGIHSGYGGPGSKTIIPASATAKLSMRLVPNQRPSETLAAICRHLEAHPPPGLRLTIEEAHQGAPGFRLPLSSPIFRLADDLLRQMDERGARYLWEGASIPIVGELQQLTGAAPLLVGFGREEDRIHSPNESFGLDQFRQVMTWATLILDAFK